MTKKETEQKIDKTSYTLDSINTEDARTAVRRHPSKELGSARRNTNLISEIYANSVDEHVIGHGNQIDVIVDTVKNEYTVTDYGQGFLVNAGIDKNGKTILQRSFDTMNTSGKSKDGNVYQGSSLGTNGIGAKLANWLSKSLHVITYRDGEFEELWFKDGLFDKRKVGKSKRPSGTTVTWSPDAKFFYDNTPDVDELKEHFETICALCPDLTTNFTYNGKCISYHEPDGLNGYVSKHIKTEIFDKRFLMKRELGPCKLDICITYTNSYDEHLQAYVNLGATDAGVHITAFHQALSKAINKYAQSHNLLKAKEKSISVSEISEGLFVVFNYTANKVDYGAQVKTKVDFVDTALITNTISGDFGTWLEENSTQANTIVERAILARRAREASRKAKEAIRSTAKKPKSLFANLPTKLSDCYPKNKSDRSSCELYICLKGDTKVKLLDGTSPTIESMVGKEDLWSYSLDKAGQMIPAKIKKVFKTQEVKDTIKITLNDGSIVECTPEHKFLDRDTCTWVQAKELKLGQSLFSMKFRYNAPRQVGREEVWIPRNTAHGGHWELTYQRVAAYLGISNPYDGKNQYDIHHIDLNKLNNNPSNLQYITKKEHLDIHNRINYANGIMDYDKKHFTSESRLRMQRGVYKRSDAGINRQRKAVSDAWKSGNYQNYYINRLIHAVKDTINKYGTLSASTWKDFNASRKDGMPKYNNLLNYFNSYDELIEDAKNYNLTVEKIEKIHYDKPIPVYCLNIDSETHAFTLASGLVTHNCEGDSAASSILATRDSTFIAVYPIRGKILNCQGATMDKILANQEISGLVKALGLDTDKTTGKSIYDEKKLRYNKIVIVTDQDEDGFAISNLIFTVIDWLCPELVTKGHLFRIYSSLFSVIMKDGTIHNFSSKADFESWKSKNKKAQYEVSRIKGLGEMDKEMAYAQLTNPATRDLRQFTVKNYTEFGQYLEDFEGNSVDNRRDYLEEHFNDYTE